MGFERFGAVSFTAETKAAAFVDYLDGGKVMATKCRGCGHVYFPPRMDCADCSTGDTEWVEIGGKGKLTTYTTVNYGPTGFEDDSPYVLALAEFAGGVKVFGRVSKEIGEKEIEVGMDVRVAPVKLSGEKIAYQFEKA
ncbi:Zn-ribbon domain-containing OB-fold protein [Chloroflexota bacterium]